MRFLRHRTECLVVEADIRVIAGEFAANVGQGFKESRHTGDLLPTRAAARFFAARQIIRSLHPAEGAVRVPAVHIAEKRAALLPCGPEKPARGFGECCRVAGDFVVRDTAQNFTSG